MSTTVRGPAHIPLPIDVCWQKFRDLSRPLDYMPGLGGVRITTEEKEGVGASRVVSHVRFGEMDETVVAWEEGVGMTIRLHKGEKPPTPFKEGQFRYEFLPVGDDACGIHAALTYTLPGGFLGRLLDRLVLARIFRGIAVETAVCLAQNYRNDAPVDHDRLSELRKQAL